MVALAVARNVDFYGMHLIVDVDGGYGELIASILSEHPSMRGILFDLAHAIAAAGSVWPPPASKIVARWSAAARPRQIRERPSQGVE